MIIGGTKETSYRQFRVNPNAMSVEVLDDLPFPFDYGSCHEYNEDFAVACAGADNKEHCWELSGATDQWTQVGDTAYEHYSGDLGKFKKSAVIVAGYSDTHGATEIFDPVSKGRFDIIHAIHFASHRPILISKRYSREGSGSIPKNENKIISFVMRIRLY